MGMGMREKMGAAVEGCESGGGGDGVEEPADTQDLSRMGREGLSRRSSIGEADFCFRQLKLVHQSIQEADYSRLQVSPSSQEISVGRP